MTTQTPQTEQEWYEFLRSPVAGELGITAAIFHEIAEYFTGGFVVQSERAGEQVLNRMLAACRVFIDTTTEPQLTPGAPATDVEGGA